MFHPVVRRCAAVAACLALLGPASALAAPFQQWLDQQLRQHPAMTAAERLRDAGDAEADDLSRPRYNPDLTSQYEREGDANNYRIGLSQTIDVWGKRRGAEHVAQATRDSAALVYAERWAQRRTDALQALVAWRAAAQRAELAAEQEQQLGTLLSDIERRRQVGDLGAADSALATLSSARVLADTAAVQAELGRSEMALQALLPAFSPTAPVPIPDALWSLPAGEHASAPPQHPRLLAARAQWQQLQQLAQQARREYRADPTVGLNAGRSGDDSVIGVELSIPLNLRDRYSARQRLADQQALAAEADYQSLERELQFAAAAAASARDRYRERLDQWQQRVAAPLARSATLLHRQWQQGDLSTADYLQALQQRREGLQAGIELEAAWHTAYLDWLRDSGQLDAALAALTEQGL